MEKIRAARQAKGYKAIRDAYKSLEGMKGVSAEKTRRMLAEQDTRERKDRELDVLLDSCEDE